MSARFLVACCTASLLLIVPATAGASTSSLSGDGSAVDQYAQSVSTGGGKATPGVGKHKKTALDKKSAATLRRVDKSAQKVLKLLVTDSWSGATGTNLRGAKTSSVEGDRSSLVGSLLAPIVSPGAGSGSRLIGLLAVMVSITAVSGVAAARKQRALHQTRH